MFETTIAGSLPRPDWLAEPEKLKGGWKLGANLSYTYLDDRVNDAQLENPVVSLMLTKAFE